MKTVLVTGGAGYIGSICCGQLLAEGHSVVALDDLSTGFEDALPEGVTFYKCDVGDRPKVRQVLSRHAIDVVFHFAAKALVPESVSNPGIFFDCNVAAGILLEELPSGIRKFVFPPPRRFTAMRRRYPSPRITPRIITSYGEISFMFARSRLYARAYSWGVAALRYFNACGALKRWGAPRTGNASDLLLKAPSRYSRGGEVYGADYPTPDGTCLRDYACPHIADAHIRLCARRGGNVNLQHWHGQSHPETGAGYLSKCAARRSPPLRRSVGGSGCARASPRNLMQRLGRHGTQPLSNIVRSAWEFHSTWRTRHAGNSHRPLAAQQRSPIRKMQRREKNA
jgi:UDP-glucose 4-epimerase